MSILDKFTRNDLNSLCGMNSFFHDMYSDDLHANRNIEQRINEAIYVVKLKIKYIHPPRFMCGYHNRASYIIRFRFRSNGNR